MFIPRDKYRDKPALLVELKWNNSVDTAMNQIKERKYPNSFKEYEGNILLVAVSYDKKTKKHYCVIEKHLKNS